MNLVNPSLDQPSLKFNGGFVKLMLALVSTANHQYVSRADDVYGCWASSGGNE